jgi:ABC-2 type transport system ATP-binding protein
VLHEPEVLFLDEPTSGLDPAAAREVRDLIAALRGEGRTILLCTHNLAEAESLADLVGILSGRLLAFGPPAALAGGLSGVEVRMAEDSARFVAPVLALPAVKACTSGGQWLRVELADLRRDTPLLVAELVRLGAPVLGITPLGDSLEAFYLRAVRGHPAAA